MMVSVTENGFRFDDESAEELRQAWASGERVLVVPSRRRLQFRQSVSKLLRVVALRHAASDGGQRPVAMVVGP